MNHLFLLEPRRLLAYDLAMLSLTVDQTTVSPGGTLTGSTVITNQGDAPFAGGSVYFALTQRQDHEHDDETIGVLGRLGQINLQALNVGDSATLSLTLPVARPFPTGLFFFSAVASDRTDAILDPNDPNLDLTANDADSRNNSLSAAHRVAVVPAGPTVGKPDTSFGFAGVATNFVPQALDVVQAAYDPHTGEQFAAVTLTTPQGPRTAIIHLTADGQVDQAYGNRQGGVFDPPAAPSSRAKSISRLEDGSYLVIGMTPDHTVIAGRLGSDGTPVAAFGTNGLLVLAPGAFNGIVNFDVTDVLSTPDHSAYLVGTAGLQTARRIAVVKLTPSGQPDMSYGQGGVLQFNALSVGADSARAAVLLPDGRVVIAGGALKDGLYVPTALSLSPNGTRDDTFGTDGHYEAPGTAAYRAYTAIAADPAGNLYLAGFATGADRTSSQVFITKLTPRGKPFPKFATAGNALLSTGDAFASGATIIPSVDGGAILSARTATSIANIKAGMYGTSLLRVTPAGKLQPTFASNGILVLIAAPATVASASLRFSLFDTTTTDDLDTYAASTDAQAQDVGGGKVRLLATSTDDTTSSTTLTATQVLADGVDLSATTTTVLSGAALDGKSGTIKLTVSNLGTLTSSGTSTLTVRLMTSLDATTGIAIATTAAKLALAPGTSKTLTAKYAYPASVTTPANYYVAAALTTATATTDIDTTNNTATATGVIRVGPAFTDVSFALVEPITLVSGKSNTVKVTVTNAGNVAAAGPASVHVLLTDGAGTTLLDLGTTPLSGTVKPNATATLALKGKIPATTTLPAGAYLTLNFSGKLITLDADATDNTALSESTVT